MEQTTNNILSDPRIRLNIKQTSKGQKYYDITCRAETIEELKSLFNDVERYAIDEKGCIKGEQSKEVEE